MKRLGAQVEGDAAGDERAVGGRRLVCIGCRDPDLGELGRSFTLELVHGMEGLALALSSGSPRDRAIVIDSRSPNPLSVVFLSADPAQVGDSVIVLWGASRIETNEVRKRFTRARSIVLDRVATAADVAQVLWRWRP